MAWRPVSIWLLFCLFLRVRCASKGHHSIIDDSPQARAAFNLADADNNTWLTHAELHSVFLKFDKDGDGNVDSNEFLEKWQADNLGTIPQGFTLFSNLDVNKDKQITEASDLPFIFIFFDRDSKLIPGPDLDHSKLVQLWNTGKAEGVKRDAINRAPEKLRASDDNM